MNDYLYVSNYSCLVLAILLGFAIWRSRRESLASFFPIVPKTWLLLLLIFSFALFLRLAVTPHRHYVFYDEYEHINIAQNLSESGRFVRCDLFLDGQCLQGETPHWTPGYHFLLAIIFKIFGVSEAVAYTSNAWMGAVSIFPLFGIIFLLTRKEAIALTAGFLLAFIPLHLKFSGNASPEMASFLFISLSILALLILFERRSSATLFQFVAIAAFMVMIRPENVLLLVIFVFWMKARRIPSHYFEQLINYSFLFLPYVVSLSPIMTYESKTWAKTYGDMPFLKVFITNLSLFVSNLSIPLTCAIGAACGGYALFKRDRLTLGVLLAYFFGFNILFSLVHRTFTNDSARYGLQLLLPLVILAAVGWEYIYQKFSIPIKSKRLALGLMFVIVVSNYIWCWPYVYAEISRPLYQKQHEAFLKGKDFDPQAVFITYNPPSIITTIGKSAVKITYLFDENIYAQYLKQRPLILVHDDWCAKDGEGLCSKGKASFELMPAEDLNLPKGLFYRMRSLQ